MGYLRTMGAGLAGSTTKLYGNANVNQIQYGDKLQGLPPVTGARRPYKVYKSKAGGNAPGRFRVFCLNQLGGVGNVKNSQFAPNADGVGWCPNPMNSRKSGIGIHMADRGDNASRSQSRADEKPSFTPYCAFTPAEVAGMNQRLATLRSGMDSSSVIVAMGHTETIFNDIGMDHGDTYTLDRLHNTWAQDRDDITYINGLISQKCLWVNRTINGKGVSLGDHVLKVIPVSALEPLQNAGYGVVGGSGGSLLNLVFFAAVPDWLGNIPHDMELEAEGPNYVQNPKGPGFIKLPAGEGRWACTVYPCA